MLILSIFGEISAVLLYGTIGMVVIALIIGLILYFVLRPDKKTKAKRQGQASNSIPVPKG